MSIELRWRSSRRPTSPSSRHSPQRSCKRRPIGESESSAHDRTSKGAERSGRSGNVRSRARIVPGASRAEPTAAAFWYHSRPPRQHIRHMRPRRPNGLRRRRIASAAPMPSRAGASSARSRRDGAWMGTDVAEDVVGGVLCAASDLEMRSLVGCAEAVRTDLARAARITRGDPRPGPLCRALRQGRDTRGGAPAARAAQGRSRDIQDGLVP